MGFTGDPLDDTTGLDQPFVPTDPTDLLLFKARQAAASNAASPAPAPVQQAAGTIQPQVSRVPAPIPQQAAEPVLYSAMPAQVSVPSISSQAPAQAPVPPYVEGQFTQQFTRYPASPVTAPLAPYAQGQYTQYAPAPGAQVPMADPNLPAPQEAQVAPGGPVIPYFSPDDTDPYMYGPRAAEAAAATSTAPIPATTSFGEKPLMGAPPVTQMNDLEADTRALVKGIPMVGAQRVGLDPLQIQGANQMQAALTKLGTEYEALGKRAAAGEERYMQEFDKYRTGLGELAARGEQMRGARGVERQVEAQQTAASQMAFDANRVYQDLSQSPMQTGALALAAGIVQGLQGYAGQDKPNAIIAAVQDAAQRDVANQIEQYKRMQAGQQVSRNNFMEARQSLQDDQQALQITAMATLDQIGKGLDFIKARTLRAKDRADIEQAMGKINMELGNERVKLTTEFANRALTAAMANQREASDIVQKVLSARDAFNKQTASAQQKAIDRLDAWTKTEDGMAMTNGLSNVTSFYKELAEMKARGATDKQIFGAISQSFLEDLTKNLRVAANNVKGEDSNALALAFKGLAAQTIADYTSSPEEKKLQSMVADSFSAYLRQTLGKSQTSPELVNARLVVDLKDANSVLNFMNKIVSNAQVLYQQQTRIDPVGAPKWYEAYGSQIDLANAEYNRIGAGVKQSAQLFKK